MVLSINIYSSQSSLMRASSGHNFGYQGTKVRKTLQLTKVFVKKMYSFPSLKLLNSPKYYNPLISSFNLSSP